MTIHIRRAYINLEGDPHTGEGAQGATIVADADRARRGRETRYAVVRETRAGTYCWTMWHKAFTEIPLGSALMQKAEAEAIARAYGGAIVPVVVRDQHGPCCYRADQGETA